jgi:hypothetical protein
MTRLNRKLTERVILNLKIANISRRLAVACENRGDIASAREHRAMARKAETEAKTCERAVTPTVIRPDYMAMAREIIATMNATR